jgi:hypothetical protein
VKVAGGTNSTKHYFFAHSYIVVFLINILIFANLQNITQIANKKTPRHHQDAMGAEIVKYLWANYFLK